jgi:hypothetical protein
MGTAPKHPSKPGDRRAGALYALALLVEVLLFHRHVLFLRDYVFPWDFRGVHVPLATFVASSFRRGELPLWDPYTYCGYPIYANIQTALFHPPALLAALAGAWLGPASMPRLLAIAQVGQIWIAGISTYALLRRLGTRPGAAWIAGTVYELGCFFASQAQHMGAVGAAAWLPLAWLCVVERAAALPLLAVALALTILAGLPQAAVAAFVSVLVLAVLMVLFRLGGRVLPWRVLAAGAWAVLLAAVQIAPTAELTRNSVAQYRAEWLHTGGGIQPGALLTLLVPNYWGVFDLSKFHGPGDPTFLYLYSSLAGLTLALTAMFWKPDRWRRVFTLLTLCAALWMLGDSTPLGRALFQALPVGIRIGVHPEFALEVFALGMAVLAGLGAHRLFRGRRLEMAAGVMIALDLLAVSSGRPFNVSSTAAEPGMTRDSVDGSRDLVTRLRSLTGVVTPPYRFDTADASYSWSSSAPLLELPTANGCDPLAPERVIQVRLSFAPGSRWGTCYQVVNAGSPVLGLIGARYLISRSPLTGPALRPAGEFVGYQIFENERALPRFFLTGRVRLTGSLGESAAVLHAPGFDPSVAIVETPSFDPLPEAAPPGSVEVLSYAPTRIALRTHSAAPALLVATDTWYPGWKAFVDGAPARLYIADVAFRGIRVPAGDTRVEMRFTPRILYASAAVSALALAAAIFAMARRGITASRCRGGWPSP